MSEFSFLKFLFLIKKKADRIKQGLVNRYVKFRFPTGFNNYNNFSMILDNVVSVVANQARAYNIVVITQLNLCELPLTLDLWFLSLSLLVEVALP